MVLEELTTGRMVEVEVILATKQDIHKIKKKDGWNFDWKEELQYEVCKLVPIAEPQSILGLMSLDEDPAGHYMEIMHLECSPGNIGKDKEFDRIAGNLIAHACNEAIERGMDG